MSEHRPKVGVGVIIFKDGKVLFNKRKGSFAAGEYGTTGGHLEFGESFAQGVLREIEEENGIKVKNLTWLHIANITKYAPEHFVDITLRADWESGEPEIREPKRCEEWQWHDPAKTTFEILQPCEWGLKSLFQGDAFKQKDYYRIHDKNVSIATPKQIEPHMIEGDGQLPRVGVGVMIMKGNKVLIGKRKGAHSAGVYTLPGGHLHHLEGFEEGARREIMEETGLELGELKLCAVLNDILDGKHYITLSFVGQTTGKPELREPDKNEGWQWCDLDNIPEPLWIISRRTIEHYQNGTIVDDPFMITVNE